MSKKETIIVRVAPEVKKNLHKLAKANIRELSDYIRLLYQLAIDKKFKF